jgi:hypothetical protein
MLRATQAGLPINEGQGAAPWVPPTKLSVSTMHFSEVPGEQEGHHSGASTCDDAHEALSTIPCTPDEASSGDEASSVRLPLQRGLQNASRRKGALVMPPPGLGGIAKQRQGQTVAKPNLPWLQQGEAETRIPDALQAASSRAALRQKGSQVLHGMAIARGDAAEDSIPTGCAAGRREAGTNSQAHGRRRFRQSNGAAAHKSSAKVDCQVLTHGVSKPAPELPFCPMKVDIGQLSTMAACKQRN